MKCLNGSEKLKNNILMRKIVLYIVYGDKQEYYDGAKFSILTYKYWTKTFEVTIN